MRIPLFRPVVSEEAIAAVAEVLRSGWLGLGPRTAAFEQEFAAWIGAPQCVALNSGTAALHLALRVLDLPRGSEVLTTPMTFISTNHAILYEGLRPVFADVQPDTGNIDPASISDRLSDRTSAIIVVHYGGYPCDLDEIYRLAGTRGIPVVEDCAHACGATYHERRVGSHGQLHAFSFQAVKNLPAAEGGALTLGSEQYGDRLRRLRWLGIDRDTFERSGESAYEWGYDVVEVGFKYHFNDVCAAIALAQLPRVDAENQRRAEVAAHYRDRLRDVPGATLLRRDRDRQSSNHLFALLVEDRDQLAKRLTAAGVEVGVHYRRNDQYRMFEEAELPNAEDFARRVMSLPMHLALSDDDVDYVCDVITDGW